MLRVLKVDFQKDVRRLSVQLDIPPPLANRGGSGEDFKAAFDSIQRAVRAGYSDSAG